MENLTKFEKLNSRKNMMLSLIETAIPSVIVQFILGLIPFLNLFFMTKFFPANTPSSNVISVITPSIWLLNAFCYFPILGTSVSYAMMISQKKYKEANDYANTGFFIGLTFSICISIIGYFALEPFLWITSHGNEQVYEYSKKFIHGMIVGYPLWATSFYMSFMIRNYGWIWKSMFNFVILIISVSTIEFLFLKFIYSPNPSNLNLGFSLIGYSNSLAYVVIWIVAFVYLHTKEGFHFKIRPNKRVLFNKNALTIMKMGSSSFVLNLGTTLISFITNIAFAWIVIPDLASRVSSVAGSNIFALSNSDYWQFIFGLLLPIWIIFLNPTYGINAASRLLLAHNYARHDKKRVDQIIKHSLFVNFAYLIFVEFIILVAGQYILNIFQIHNGITKDYNGQIYQFNFANSDARLILGIFGLFYFTYALPAVNLGIAQILHKAFFANFSAIQRPVIIEVIIVIISTSLAFTLKNPWIFWWSYPIMDIISFVVGIIVFRHLYKCVTNLDDSYLERIYANKYS